MSEQRIACRTPTEGSKGTTNIPEWKFDLLRAAILEVVGAAGPEGMFNKDLRDAVGAKLSAEDLERLGKLGWHVVTVKLELEVRGEIARMDVKGPMRIARVLG
ncbi:hypothetical protein KUL25_14200 [Rhodobacteraceae bacterium N5(2021)]|uniref:Uncharacterized protein n=1 Tax=Gymnodinialimonas phycosphaerae TaxID=2841589 RepID=A0A975YES6_9RHOB|nr:hypothetical protein [Gymnodinialimonas phycosphaerae]MBY4893907.1 hypothetical protein [Gymnodinialimonas phycosphaerae]